MGRLEFSESDWAALEEHLLANELEQGAFCLAEPVGEGEDLRLLVREVIPVPPERLIKQSGSYLETDPLFFAPIVKRARAERYSLVIAHSHPFSRGRVAFSAIDDRGETALVPKVQARVPGLPHAALVVAHDAAAARIYLSGDDNPRGAAVRVVGMPIRDIASRASDGSGDESELRFDRQTRVWGAEAQKRLRALRVGVVGHGGTGSHVVQQLHHLGVWTLAVDLDSVDEASLNRLVGATVEDATEGRAKVQIAERSARALGLASEVLAASALEPEVALRLADCDVIFGCTDNLHSRRLLNRLALQYFRPLVDLGMDLELGADGALRSGGGRVTLVLPDGPCLHTMGVLVGAEVAPGYVAGDDDPRPAIVAYNGVVSSLAVTILLALVGAVPALDAAQINYLPLRARLTHEASRGLCLDCQEIRGVGGSRPLPWSYGGEIEGAA